MKSGIFFIFFFFVLQISFAQFNWVHTDGPPGTILAYLYTNDKYAFVPQSDFLFRSQDAVHWEKVESSGSGIMAINQDTIVSPYYDEALSQLKLKISINNGESWITKDLPPEIKNYGSIALCSHGIYWHQYNQGKLFKSIDLGTTWDTIFQPLEYDYDLTIFQNRLYAYSLLSMWRTDTLGENWEEINLPNSMLQNQYMDDFEVKDSNIVITTEDYIFHTHDEGISWNSISIHSSNSYDKLALADSLLYVYLYPSTLLRTNDFGFHWDTLVADADLHSIIVVEALRDIFLSSTYNQGIFHWDDSIQSFIEGNEGLGKGYIYNLSHGADKIWTACGNGVFAYDIPTETWSSRMNFPYPDFEYENVSANESGWVVASEAYKNYFYFSKNRGQDWDTIHTEHYIDNIQLINNTILITEDIFVKYRSIDQGQTWQPLNAFGYDENFIPFKGLYWLAAGEQLVYTADDGITFESISSPINIRAMSSFEDQLFALTVDTSELLDLYISNDAVNWTNAGENFPEINSFDFFNYSNSFFFFRDAEHFYAFLGEVGVFWSPVDQISWAPVSSAFTGNHWLIHDNTIYLGEKGLYKSEIINPYITGIKEIEFTQTSTFALNPNPVLDILQITFDSPGNFPKMLNLYSADGVLQYSKEISPSEKEIDISLKELPPSIYHVVLISHNRVESKSCLKL